MTFATRKLTDDDETEYWIGSNTQSEDEGAENPSKIEPKLQHDVGEVKDKEGWKDL